MNSLKEIEATESLYELEKEVRNCESYEGEDTYDNCTTKYFVEQQLQKCGCLPYAIINAEINNEKVYGKYDKRFLLICFKFYLRFPLVLPKKSWHALKQLCKIVNQQNASGTIC